MMGRSGVPASRDAHACARSAALTRAIALTIIQSCLIIHYKNDEP